MAFQFSLATLLRLREIAEQREERLLGQIQNQIAQNRQTLADLALQRHKTIQQREDALNQTTSAADILNFYAKVRAIEDLEESCQEQLSKLLVLRDTQMKIYQAASRSSEVLSEMRDDHRETFHKLKSKQEQNMLDDNFSSRRNFN